MSDITGYTKNDKGTSANFLNFYSNFSTCFPTVTKPKQEIASKSFCPHCGCPTTDKGALYCDCEI